MAQKQLPEMNGEAPQESIPLRKPLGGVVVALLGGALFLIALLVIGKATREWLKGQDRATIAFASIECDSPPGLDRSDFLDEVQYLAGMPDQLQLLDSDLAKRLADAFAVHPWVEAVEQVQLGSRRQVRVQLTFRTPVLAVPLSGKLRAVDRHGVLLPVSAPTDGLPVFPGTANPPSGPAGTRWGDAAVEEAARRTENRE